MQKAAGKGIREEIPRESLLQEKEKKEKSTIRLKREKKTRENQSMANEGKRSGPVDRGASLLKGGGGGA